MMRVYTAVLKLVETMWMMMYLHLIQTMLTVVLVKKTLQISKRIYYQVVIMLSMIIPDKVPEDAAKFFYRKVNKTMHT